MTTNDKTIPDVVGTDVNFVIRKPGSNIDIGSNITTVEQKDESNRSVRSPYPSMKRAEQMAILFKVVDDVEFFHNEISETFFSFVASNGGLETYSIKLLPKFLHKRFYKECRQPPAMQVIKEAVRTLDAMALYDGVEKKVFIRSCKVGGKIYYDLANRSRDVVVIDEHGWTITNRPDNVHFLRFESMEDNSIPEKKGDINLLRKYINIGNDENWILFLGWLITTCIPQIPYAVLVLMGTQGSAKSISMEFIQDLVDPSKNKPSGLSGSERDFAVSAYRRRVLFYDNISKLNDDMSDLLCRTSTGSSFSKRKNFSDDEEKIFNLHTPVVLNGIGCFITRGDLLDRSIILNIPPISEDMRKTENEIRSGFYKDRPKIMAAIFDTISFAMKNYNSVNVKLPRMADLTQWAVAAEPALGLSGGDFLRVYMQSIKNRRLDLFSTDTLALAVEKLLEQINPWSGTATQLIDEFDSICPREFSKVATKDKHLNTITSSIMRLEPILKEKGISVGRSDSRRSARIFYLRKD